MKNKLMRTIYDQIVMPPLCTLLEHNGATYGVIVEVLTNETPCEPGDVQLLLGHLVRDGYLTAEDGIYRLNHNEENDELFRDCIKYNKEKVN